MGLIPDDAILNFYRTPSRHPYDDFIEDSAARHGIDPDLIRAQMNQESTNKPGALSPKGASGLMQLMPDTARAMGVKNIYDPKQNIEGGVKYLKQQLDQFGSVPLALAAYNAGPGAVQKYGNKVPPYKETRDYVKKITSRYQGDGSYFNPVRAYNGMSAPEPQSESEPEFDPIGTYNGMGAASALQTDAPIPESQATLTAQTQAMHDPASSRIGVLYTKGTQPSTVTQGEIDIPLPGDQTLRIDNDKFNRYNEATGVTESDLMHGRADFTPLIGGKAESTPGIGSVAPIAVHTTDAQGNELVSSGVSDPTQVPVQAALDKLAFPNQPIQTSVVDSGDVIAKRLLDIQREHQPIPTTTNDISQLTPQAQPQLPLLTRRDGQQFHLIEDRGKTVKVQDAKTGGITLQAKRKFTPQSGNVSVSVNPQDFNVVDEQGQPIQPVQQQPQLTQPREFGKPTDDLNRVAGEYTPTQAKDTKDAMAQAVASVGRQYGITPEQAQAYVNSPHVSLPGDWQQGDKIQVPFATIAVIKGQQPTVADIRTEQAQARTEQPIPNLNVPHISTVSDEDIKNVADKTFGSGTATAIGGLASGANYLVGLAGGIADLLDSYSPVTLATRSVAEARPMVNDANGDPTIPVMYENNIVAAMKNFHAENQKFVTAMQDIDPATGKETWPSAIVQFGTELPFQLAGLVAIPGGPLVSFPVNAAALTKIQGGTGTQVVASAAKGLATAGLFGTAGKFADLVGITKPFAKAGTQLGYVGAGSFALGKSLGDSNWDALKDSLVNTAFMLHSMGGVEVADKNIRIRDEAGNAVAAKIEPDGKVISVDPAAPADIEMLQPKASFKGSTEQTLQPLETGKSPADLENERTALANPPVQDRAAKEAAIRESTAEVEKQGNLSNEKGKQTTDRETPVQAVEQTTDRETPTENKQQIMDRSASAGQTTTEETSEVKSTPPAPAKESAASEGKVVDHGRFDLETGEPLDIKKERLARESPEQPAATTAAAETGGAKVKSTKPPTTPKSLSQFVRSSGGIKKSSWNKGEAEQLSPKETGTTGLFNNKSGTDAERMAESAWESGYLRDVWPDISDRNGNELIQHVLDDLHGIHKHYALDAYEELDKNIADQEQEYHEQKATNEAATQRYQEEHDELVGKQAKLLTDPDAQDVLAKVADKGYSTKWNPLGFDDPQNEESRQFQFLLEKHGIDSGRFARTVLEAYKAERASQENLPSGTSDIIERGASAPNEQQVTAFDQADLFGRKTTPQTSQPEMFDTAKLEAESKATARNELESAYGKRTATYIDQLEQSPNPKVAMVAKEMRLQAKAVSAKGTESKELVEASANALDLFTRAEQTNRDVAEAMKQGRLDGVEYSPQEVEFAKAMESGAFPKVFRDAISNATTIHPAIISNEYPKYKDVQEFGKTIKEQSENILKAQEVRENESNQERTNVNAGDAEVGKVAEGQTGNPPSANAPAESAASRKAYQPSESAVEPERPTRAERSTETGEISNQPERGGGTERELESPKTTSLKNAVAASEREERGLPPMEKTARREWETVKREAEDQIAKNPRAEDDLVKELLTKPRVLSDTEEAVLLHKKVSVRNEHNQLGRELADAVDNGDDLKAADLRRRLARTADELNDIDSVTKPTGAESGRSLAFRKAMMDEDFSLASLESRKRTAKGGEPLTDVERGQLQKVADDYKAKNEALETHIAERESTIAEMKAKQPNSRIIAAAENFVNKLNTRADAARKRLEARGNVFTAGIDPLALKDLAEIGASHIADAGLDFAKWSEKMIDEFGDKIRPHLDNIWKAANDAFDGIASRDPRVGKRPSDETKLKAWKTRANKRINELTGKIQSGDFTRTTRTPIPLDAEGRKLKVQIERLTRNFLTGLEKDRLARRTKFEKGADFVANWSRASFLSWPSTIAKLTSAALQRAIYSPIEEVVGAGYSKAFPRAAYQSPTEAGLNVKAEAKAYTTGLWEGAKDAWENLKGKDSELNLLYGKRESIPPETKKGWLLAYWGFLHGALKAPIKRMGAVRGLEKRTAFDIQHGIDPDDPMEQLNLGLEAYKDGNRQVFMQDNRLVNSYNLWVRSLERKSKEGEVNIPGKLAATTLRTTFPVVRIPMNIASEIAQYAAGIPVGATKLALAYKKGIENLKPDDADLIFRQLKKGSVGTALLLLGYFNPDSIGGYYQPGQKRDESDVKFGSIKVFGYNIPTTYLHNPATEMLQIGATIRRVSDSKFKKSSEDSQGLVAGMIAATTGVAEEIPFVKQTLDLSKLLDPKERDTFFDEFIKSRAVPGISQWTAGKLDTDLVTGETIKRKPSSFYEHIETGIPFLRQNVPAADILTSQQKEAKQVKGIKATRYDEGSLSSAIDQVAKAKANGTSTPDLEDELRTKLERADSNESLSPANAKRGNELLGLTSTDILEGHENAVEKPNFVKYNKNADGIIEKVSAWAKGMALDPIDAFDKLFKGESIKRLENGTIIVQRMSRESSDAERKRQGGGGKEVKLDHTVPLELGGTNTQTNLKLVTTEEWERYTPIENYLAGALHDGTIDGTTARKLIVDFKNHWIGEKDIVKQVGEPFTGDLRETTPALPTTAAPKKYRFRTSSVPIIPR